MDARDNTSLPIKRGVRARTWLARDLDRFGPDATARPIMSRVEADEYCRQLARRHGENFVVASFLLPHYMRRHFFRIYAYCRWADDLADEVLDRDDSLRLLDWWQTELEKCYQGNATHPVFIVLQDTICEYRIPAEPFRNLLRAFRQDQRQTRYASFAELQHYCQWSANPVGHMILYLAECCDARRCALADAVCTGLQLANFCQDAARDFARGRLYFPQEELARFDCVESDFARPSATPALRTLMRFEVERAAALLRRGRPLVDLVPRWLAADVELFVSGGLEVLRLIQRSDYDVWHRRPSVGRWRKLRLLAHAWRFRK